VSAYLLIDNVRVFTSTTLAHIGWISDILADHTTGSPIPMSIDIKVHITGATAQVTALPFSPVEEVLATPVSEKALSIHLEKARQRSGIKVEYNRPDIFQILDEEIDSSLGPVSVDGLWLKFASLCSSNSA
jgi:hypothetical protein